ncbi:MAG: plasmid mobilization relaxosome protein MobC [Clostridia bacterium]
MKNKRLSLRISAEDLAVIKRKAEQSQMTLTDYLTKVGMKKQIIIITDLEQVSRELKAVGRNLNQAIMLANSGRIQTIYLGETLEKFTEINQSIQAVLERKRWSDGNS